MAKIDLTKITGYSETLSADEKLALLGSIDIPEPADFSSYIEKSKFDKTASELAEAKRLLKAKMTEDEQKAQEEAASRAQIQAELELLRKEKTVSESKSRFLGLGYDELLATEAASALSDGNMDKVFDAQKRYIESIRKATTAAGMGNNPNPPAGKGAPADEKAVLKEQYANAIKAGDTVSAVVLKNKLFELEKK